MTWWRGSRDRAAVRFAKTAPVALRIVLAATAVSIYDDFAHRLAAEYELEPSPETQTLMLTVRRTRSRARESPELALARAWFSAGWCGSCA